MPQDFSQRGITITAIQCLQLVEIPEFFWLVEQQIFHSLLRLLPVSIFNGLSQCNVHILRVSRLLFKSLTIHLPVDFHSLNADCFSNDILYWIKRSVGEVVVNVNVFIRAALLFL